MKSWNLLFMLLYSTGVICAPSEPTATTVKNAGSESELSAEASVPANMNLADYYYSIFGKHLDYDYREPLLTFDEPIQNELSDEVISEVDKGSDPWDTHSRKKRFIVVPANFFNTTRRWARNMRRLRLERRRLRNERLHQWRQNRIRYLQARSQALQMQAQRLSQLQAQNRQTTRSVPEQQASNNVHKIVLSFTTTTTSKPTTSTTKALSTATSVDNDPVPVKQVPIPTRK